MEVISSPFELHKIVGFDPADMRCSSATTAAPPINLVRKRSLLSEMIQLYVDSFNTNSENATSDGEDDEYSCDGEEEYEQFDDRTFSEADVGADVSASSVLHSQPIDIPFHTLSTKQRILAARWRAAQLT